MKIDDINPGQTVTVDEMLIREGHDPDDPKVRRPMIVAMQMWMAQGHGEFKIGRKGGKSRFTRSGTYSGPAPTPAPTPAPRAPSPAPSPRTAPSRTAPSAARTAGRPGTRAMLPGSDEDREPIESDAAREEALEDAEEALEVLEGENGAEPADDDEDGHDTAVAETDVPGSTVRASGRARAEAYVKSKGHVLLFVPLRRGEKIVIGLPANVSRTEIEALREYLAEIQPDVSNHPDGTEAHMHVMNSKGQPILPIGG